MIQTIIILAALAYLFYSLASHVKQQDKENKKVMAEADIKGYIHVIENLLHFNGLSFSFWEIQDWESFEKEFNKREYWKRSDSETRSCIHLLKLFIKDLFVTYPGNLQDLSAYLNSQYGSLYGYEIEMFEAADIPNDILLSQMYKLFIAEIKGADTSDVSYYLNVVKDIEEAMLPKNRKIAVQENVRSLEEEHGGMPQKCQSKNKTPELLDRAKELYQAITAIEIPSASVRLTNTVFDITYILKKIISRIETHPEQSEQIRRLVSYYMPMIIKLLDTYVELSTYQVEGENIDDTKHQIEDALLDIQQALKMMLDGLCQDTAWDISSDINVLHTMIVQDGLSENGLK